MVCDASLGHALNTLAKITRQHELEWPLIVALVQGDALAGLASDEGRPSVVVKSLVTVDFLVGNASRRNAGISPAAQWLLACLLSSPVWQFGGGGVW